MENKNLKNDNQSFLHLTQQREHAERMNRLFVRAVGDEDVSKREENVKHFDLGANRYQAVVYSEPVHFRESEDGDWQEIDNTLEEAVNAQGRAVLRNRANRMHVEFPQRMDGGSMATITDGGKTFSWRFEQDAQPIRAKVRTGAELKQERLVKQAQKMAKFVGRTIDSLKNADLSAEIETEQERRGDIARLKAENTYEEVLPGVSVRYTLRSETVKEDIILANAEALSRTAVRLPKQYDYAVDEGKKLLVKDKATGGVVFTMATPFVYDAAGKETIADVVLTDCGEYVRMEYVLDAAFMAEAQFPVTIDPVVSSTNPVHNIQDTTLGEGQSAKPYTADHLKIGKYNGSVRCVGLLKFNHLAVMPASDTVVGAVLQIRTKSSSTSNYIAAYEVLKPWESADVNWASFNPDNTANVSDQALECVQGKSSDWLSFDLTTLYRKWCTRNASGATNNNGVAFRTPANITGNNYSELYSSDASTTSYRPTMYVNYISHAGIEGWWQYEQMEAGRAGTVYADLFNGNMVLEHSDTAMTGNLMPVSVNHFYNSCLSNANNYNCGYGWKTDAHQKVTARTHNSNNYYVWEDGDGTEHFFHASGSQPYKDDEGMEMELTYTSGSPSYIIITDKEHNQMRFNVVQSGLAWLVSARDACGNTTNYSYVSGYEAAGRLDKITDPVGRVTKFTYSGSLLSNIRIPTASGYRYVYYTYDSSNRLTGVRYSELDGTAAHTTYAYDGSTKLLKKARNFDGVQVNIGYEALSLYGTENSDQARRVLSLETVATNSSGSVTKYGAKQLFNYKHMCTEVTAVDTTNSNAGKTLHYQFNDSGNVVCVRDDLGFARFTKFDSGIENKPSEESPLRRAVVNLLRHTDLSANWTASGTTAKDTSATCLGMPSVKLTAKTSGESYYRQEVTLAAKTKYTFSAYVKTQNISGAFGAYLRLSKKSNVFDNVCGDALYGTTAAAIGNGLATDGWERVYVTIDHTASSSETYYADMVVVADSGMAWFACPQLEIGSVMNTVNLLSNSDFHLSTASGSQMLPDDWSKATNTLSTSKTGVCSRSTDNTFPTALSGNYLAIEGTPNKSTYVGFVQTINVAGKSGDVFTLGGWVDSHSVPIGSSKMRLSLLFRVKKTNGSWDAYKTFTFNDEWVGWQFGCFAAAASADYTQVEITVCYVSNCNVSKFTNLFLYREAFGESFGYDSDKNLISSSTLAGQKSDIKYDSAKNITAYTQPGMDSSVADNQHWFYYGNSTDAKKHLLVRSRTPMHVTDYYSHDDYGNTTASRRVDYRVYTGNTADNAYPYIRTETGYTDDGNYTASTKDARGNTVTQVVDSNDGTLTSVTDPTGQTVSYTYDNARRVTAVQTTGNGKTYRNSYVYENDRMKMVKHNTTSDTSDDVTYTFAYDALGRKTTVKVGDQTLSTNVYENNRNGLLSEVQYGNNGKVGYSYDEYDRLTGVKYDGEANARYTYEYGANGEMAEVTDTALGRTTRTDYDLADRPCQTEVHEQTDDGRTLLYRTRLKYSKLNNLELFTEEVAGETHKSAYAYDKDNRVTSITYDGSAHKVSYVYDELGRVKTRTAECGVTAGKLTSTYGYMAGGYGTNSTTPLVASISQAKIPFEYAYDTCGNIISEKRGTLTTTYAYDALGQLIRVNDPHENATWVYNYDRGGNITSKVKYAFTTGTLGSALQTIPYGYGDTNWKDKLTSYNGQTINYDAIGNPLNDGAWTFTWAAGRQLKKMVREDRTLDFKYDHNGMRIQKTLQHDWYPETTKYTYHGKLLTHMTVDYYDWDEVAQQDKLHFFYDAQSRPAKVSYNGVLYTYVHNLQGDVVGLLDNSGNLVVEYKYDAWGKLLSTTGTLADTLGKRNPFRYRGYVYDEETGLYYLQNRYYDSNLCRFLNADHISNLGANGELLTYNGYGYCENDPINRFDSEGCWSLPNWAKAAIGVVATVAAVAVTVATGGAALPVIAGVAVSTAGGAIGGYITGGKQGAIDGAANGLMLGGLSALATSAVGAIKTVRSYKKTIDTYSSLTKQYKGSGMEAHHIIEKRLVKGSRWSVSKMPSIELTKTVHRGYTNAWKAAVPYGTRYAPGLAYKYQLYRAANTVYKGSRVLRMAARYTIVRM